MKNRTSAASLLARAAVVALLAFSAAFVAGCRGKNKAERILRAKANTECLALKNAIILYEAEFSLWPANVSGDSLVTGGNYIEMCKVLTGGNAEKKMFYEPGADYDENKGILDPWGRPYQVALDGDFDGVIKVGDIPAIKAINKAAGRGGQDLRTHAAVYSYGIDENDRNANDVAKLAEEKKIVISW